MFARPLVALLLTTSGNPTGMHTHCPSLGNKSSCEHRYLQVTQSGAHGQGTHPMAWHPQHQGFQLFHTNNFMGRHYFCHSYKFMPCGTYPLHPHHAWAGKRCIPHTHGMLQLMLRQSWNKWNNVDQFFNAHVQPKIPVGEQGSWLGSATPLQPQQKRAACVHALIPHTALRPSSITYPQPSLNEGQGRALESA